MTVTVLYHVGCGEELFDLFDSEQAASIALACRCGGNAPIVTDDLQRGTTESPRLPSSLVSVLSGASKAQPHLEYYLGFSDFTCPAKTAWEKRLREAGCISFSECSNKRCQEEPERQRRRSGKLGRC